MLILPIDLYKNKNSSDGSVAILVSEILDLVSEILDLVSPKDFGMT